MSKLIQIARGAALLCSIALVACYIDVYTTGKFPWQHAAAEEITATIPPPEFINDPAVQPAQYIVEHGATQTTPVFLPGSKSDVGRSAVVGLEATTTQPAATPIFLSGSKSFSGQTTVLSGALNHTPANAQVDQNTKPTGQQKVLPATNEPGYFLGGGKSPLGMSGRITETMPTLAPSTAPNAAPTVSTEKMQFMGGSKTIMLPPRLPESAQPRTVTPTQSPQFMGGAKSPGPLAMPNSSSPPSTHAPPPPSTVPSGVKVQGYPATNSVQGDAPQTSNPPASTNPLFMSGSKSPIREAPKNLFSVPPPAQKPTTPNAMQTAPPPAPLQITPKVAPNSQPPVQQATPRYYGDQPVSPAKSY